MTIQETVQSDGQPVEEIESKEVVVAGEPANDLTPLQRIDPFAFQPSDMASAAKLAGHLAKSKIVPDALIGAPEDIFVILMAGRELGLSVMQSLRGIDVIKGKPSTSAQTMAGLVMSSPVCEYFSLISTTDKLAVYETKRCGSPSSVRMEFSWEDAVRSGLPAKNPTYEKHPADMLRNRCASKLSRAVYPDVCQGIYLYGEIPADSPAGIAKSPVLVDAPASNAAKILAAAKAEVEDKASAARIEVEPERSNPSDVGARLTDAAKTRLIADGEAEEGAENLDKLAESMVTTALGLAGFTTIEEIPDDSTAQKLVELILTGTL